MKSYIYLYIILFFFACSQENNNGHSTSNNQADMLTDLLVGYPTYTNDMDVNSSNVNYEDLCNFISDCVVSSCERLDISQTLSDYPNKKSLIKNDAFDLCMAAKSTISMVQLSLNGSRNCSNWEWIDLGQRDCTSANPYDGINGNISNFDGEWVLINKGSYMMGRDDGARIESPKHRVNIQHSFYISKTEVTVKQYKKCVDAGICSKPNDSSENGLCNWGVRNRDLYPINCLNWYQARTFAKWVGGDLPNEAQWEYAARSRGQEIDYPWGNESPTCQLGSYQDCMREISAVCSTPSGNTMQDLCDMWGNEREWVLDEKPEFEGYFGGVSGGNAVCEDAQCDTVINPNSQISNQKHRIIRGGYSKTTFREHSNPLDKVAGIRVVRIGTNETNQELSCIEIFECANACPQASAQACAQDCLGRGSDDAIAKVNAVGTCIQNSGCAQSDQDCIQMKCNTQIAACEGSTSPIQTPMGNLDCRGFVGCLNGCDSTDSVCQNNCVSMTSLEGFNIYNTLASCVQTKCPMQDQVCISSQCGSELEACIPPGTKGCSDTLVCLNSCQTQQCAAECQWDANPVAQGLLSELGECFQTNNCQSFPCPMCETQMLNCEAN
jgi:hypothetical protein